MQTKVFAGGAHIATMSSELGDAMKYNTADPVTGTTGIFQGSSSYGGKDEETEPMGQTIELTEPPAPPSSYTEVLGNAKDPEWQCEMTTGTGNAFRLMPQMCQEIISSGKTNQFSRTRSEKSPTRTSGSKGAPPTLKPGQKLSPDELARKRAIAATGKFDNEADDANAPDVPGFNTKNSEMPDAKRRLGTSEVNALRSNLKSALAEKKCGDFVNAVISNLTNKSVNGHEVTKFPGSIDEMFDDINATGGFWVDDISVRGLFLRRSITFGSKTFTPTSSNLVRWNVSSTGLYIIGDSIKSVRGTTFELTGSGDTVNTLIHELIHAYYPGGFVADHTEMDVAAEKALKSLGIEGAMPPFDLHGTYFDAALIRACGKGT